MVLSYSHSNQTQFSTVFPSQKEMDWVGVEATTSAHSILSQSAIDGKLVQIPPSPFSVHDL